MQGYLHPLLVELGGYDQKRTEVGGYLSDVDRPVFIRDYLINTHGPTHDFGLKLIQVYEINRPACQTNYRQDLHNKRLLFHGILKQNVYPILRDGFDLSMAKNGLMFGPGIYFSDCITKSAQYTNNIDDSVRYMFLCEVALGHRKRFLDADHSAHLNMVGYDSVYGEGSHRSLSSEARYSEENVRICPGPIRYFQRNVLAYNEYVVYSTSQIRLRYLVKVRRVPKDQVPRPAPRVRVPRPAPNAQISTPAINAQVSTPAINAQAPTPVSNAQVSTPVSNAQVSTPVSNAQVSTLVSNGRGNTSANRFKLSSVLKTMLYLSVAGCLALAIMVLNAFFEADSFNPSLGQKYCGFMSFNLMQSYYSRTRYTEVPCS